MDADGTIPEGARRAMGWSLWAAALLGSGMLLAGVLVGNDALATRGVTLLIVAPAGGVVAPLVAWAAQGRYARAGVALLVLLMLIAAWIWE